MTDLTREQRGALRTAISVARQEAEAAAADALRRLGVAETEAPAHLDAEKRKQRNRLRAHARALGDARAANGAQAITRLTEQAAYVQWHRLLFARFLIERKLLREETGATVSLKDCREIAFGEGAGADEWSVAAGFAAAMLPGVFPADDPVESLVLAPEHARTLRQRLLCIDAAAFQADDSLGWTYQFWREAEKEAVNAAAKAGHKIGAAELPAVTQLFTEPYMVRFLVHNTLGAWWAGKRLAANPSLARNATSEAALRSDCALPGYGLDYLRFVREDGTWRPAAGTFPGWPTTTGGLTVLDPCCGSGHFLTEALSALTALRRAEEGLSPSEAVAAVLRDNLAGLEIDGRCVQIAAFNLALTGWRIGGPGTMLPTPNVAWVGAPPPLPMADFVALADGDVQLRRGLEALHDLFRQAPLLGSLIEPLGGDLADPRRVARIEDSIAALVERMRGAEPDRAEGVVAARGMADAAAILSSRWALQITNVPFLGRQRQVDALREHLSGHFEAAKADLATAMLLRMLTLSSPAGTIAAVMPQYWLFLSQYEDTRNRIINDTQVNITAKLGSGAFETISGEVVRVCLFVTSNIKKNVNKFSILDVSDESGSPGKSRALQSSELTVLGQQDQAKNPDMIIGYDGDRQSELLEKFAYSYQGLATSDNSQFVLNFWEVPAVGNGWEFFQMAPEGGAQISGCSWILHWENGSGRYYRHTRALKEVGRLGGWRSGEDAWSKLGVAVNRMGDLSCAVYTGAMFDCNVAVVIPNRDDDFRWIFSRINRPSYAIDVRKLNQKSSVTNLTLTKVAVTVGDRDEAGPPSDDLFVTDDPTQWLFHGHPRYAASGTELHVALARLSGYRWPAETDATMRLSSAARARIAEAATLPPADADGLLPLSPLLGERGLADRLRVWCATAWGKAWTADTEAALITAACERANERPPRTLTLDAWLRTHAARQHSKLFHDRPFLWWITDGRADGFMAVVLYHRLTRDALSRLAFHVLGDHLARLGDDPRVEAARILQKKLEQIIEGEAPYDIFVRWKPLHEQPLGWDPDLDDGVRLNIRPFVEAAALTHVPNVKYGVDRGKDAPSAPWYHVFSGERRTDHHTTLAEKRAARAAVAGRAARAAK